MSEEIYAFLRKQKDDLDSLLGIKQCETENYRRGYEAGAQWLLKQLDQWCSINAYDSDKGACDEHTCDDTRGKNCSAQELLDYSKGLCGEV